MPAATMRISIVIPTLTEAQNLGPLLQDLAGFRDHGHEILLVDGGSEDRTVAQAEGQVDRVLLGTRGRAAQMNAGAGVAKGDILWFVHADSRVPADAAGSLIDACGAGHHWGRFDVRLSGSHWLLRVVESTMNLRSHLSGIVTGDQGIFVTREAFESVNGFPQIALMEDIALSKRLRRWGRPARIRRPPLQTSSRRWEKQGILRTVLHMWQLRLAYALGAEPQDLARRYR